MCQHNVAFRDHFQVQRRAAGSGPRLQLNHQRGNITRRALEQKLRILARPAKRLVGGVALHRQPAFSEQQARVRGGDVVRVQDGLAIGRDVVGSFAHVDADQVRLAIIELLFDGGPGRNIAHRIVPVDTVHPSVLEPPGGEEASQLARKQDIDVGSQYVFAAGAPNADVLSDHLVQRQGVSVRKAARAVRAVLRSAGFRKVPDRSAIGAPQQGAADPAKDSIPR